MSWEEINDTNVGLICASQSKCVSWEPQKVPISGEASISCSAFNNGVFLAWFTPRILSSLFLFSTCFCPFVSASAAWTEKAERSETVTGQNVPDGVASSPRGLEPLCGAVICD